VDQSRERLLKWALAVALWPGVNYHVLVISPPKRMNSDLNKFVIIRAQLTSLGPI
jgi:hypothetical protein